MGYQYQQKQPNSQYGSYHYKWILVDIVGVINNLILLYSDLVYFKTEYIAKNFADRYTIFGLLLSTTDMT